MPLQRRIPKRGFHNRGRVEYVVVNLRDLNRLETPEITLDTLRSRMAAKRRKIKVLGMGEPERAMQVEAHAFSASARRKIEAAGGTVTVSTAR